MAVRMREWQKRKRDLSLPGDDWMTFPLIKIKMTSVKRRECETYNFSSHAEDDDEEDQDMATKSKRSCTKKAAPEGFVSELTSDEEESVNGVKLPNYPTAPQKLPSIQDSNVLNSADLSGFVGRHTSRSCASEEIQDGYRYRSGSGSSNRSRPIDDSSLSGFRRWDHASRSGSRRRDHDASRSRSGSRCRDHASRSGSRCQDLDASRSGSRRQDHASRSGSRRRNHASRSRSGSRHRDHASRSEPQNDSFRSGRGSWAVPLPLHVFQTKVLNLLLELRNYLKHVQPPSSAVHIERMETMEDFEREEERLVNIKTFDTLVLQISRIGGKNTKDFVHKVLDRLFTNALMSKFNMKGKGKRGKKPLEMTKVYRAIKDGIMNGDAAATEDFIRTHAAEHLKHAPQRSGGGGHGSQD